METIHPKLMRRAAVFATSLLIACGGHDSPTQPPPVLPRPPRFPAAIARAGGDSATSDVGALLPAPLRVRVTARNGDGVEGVRVQWSADAGSLAAATTTTDANGYATNTWRLGTAPGTEHVHATAGSVGSVEFIATARTGPLAVLRIDPTLAMLQSGGTLQIAVTRTEDAFGNPITAAGLTIAWSTDAPAIADVAPNGLVSAHARGSVMIVAAAGGASDTAYLKVDEIAWKTVSVGRYHTCALAADGRLFCWGQNAYGELGDGTTTPRAYPAPVAGSASYSAINSNTYHSCALGVQGEAYCWGDNPNGVYGATAQDRAYVPTPVAPGVSFASISTGMWQNCGLTAAGEAYCWGTRLDGMLGDGRDDGTFTATPSRVLGGPYRQLAAGVVSTCAVGADSAAYCWGEDLMTGMATHAATPQRIAAAGHVTQVSAGYSHSCARTAAGDAFCWGSNYYGEIGDGSSGPPPAQGIAFSGAAEVGAGQYYSCGLTLAGEVRCWGNLDSNAGGSPDPARVVPRPEPIPLPEPALHIAANGYGWHSCAVTRRGNVYCWGNNVFGQLGDGTTTTRDTPARILEPR